MNPPRHTPQLSAPPRSSSHFFQHHGVWAPGVRLFRRLQFGAKAGWISLAFLVPIVLLLLAYVRTSQATIDFAGHGVGVFYCRVISTVDR